MPPHTAIGIVGRREQQYALGKRFPNSHRRFEGTQLDKRLVAHELIPVQAIHRSAFILGRIQLQLAQVRMAIQLFMLSLDLCPLLSTTRIQIVIQIHTAREQARKYSADALGAERSSHE